MASLDKLPKPMSPQHFALVWQVASTQTRWLDYVVGLTSIPSSRWSLKSSHTGFAIPILLMVVSSSSRKLIEGTPWSRRHFYLGLDLTIYFLAACMINVCDLAKDHTRLASSSIWTLCVISLGIVILLVQAAFHWSARSLVPVGLLV